MPASADRIEVLNVNQPGHVGRVDRTKYDAMRAALLTVLPHEPPGLTAAQAKAAVTPILPEPLFPGGATAGWWLKCVQLDLEAREIIRRANTKPLRWHQV